MYATIYSVHNFVSKILEASKIMSFKKILQAQYIYLLKFISAMFFTNICDSKKCHKYVLSFCIFLYGLSFFFLGYLCMIENINYRKFTMWSLLITYVISNGGTFPILDSMFLRYLKAENMNPSRIAKLRLAGSIGHLGINVFLSLGHAFYKRNYSNSSQIEPVRLNTSLCLILGIITLLLTITLPPCKSEDKKKEKWSFKKAISDLSSLISPTYVAYCFSILCLGIDRVGVSSFLSNHFKACGLDESEIHLIYIWRCLPELFIYGLAEYLSKFMSLDLIFCLAVLLTSLRSFFYGLFDLNYSKTTNVIIYSTTEVSKGIYSALYHYSAIRIFALFASKETTSTSQGILYSLYNSIPYILISGFNFLFPDKDKIDGKELKKFFILVGAFSVLAVIGPIARKISNKK